MKRWIALALVVVSSLALTGCPASLRGDTYSRGEVLQTQRVRYATIEALRPVRIEGTKSPVGSAAGAIVGGIAGSKIGKGRGSQIGAVLGSVAGGLAGSAAEELMTRSDGAEITVRVEGSGDVLAVVQAVGPNEVFMVGDRVRLLTVNGRTRVAY